jgi:hypothetical protein
MIDKKKYKYTNRITATVKPGILIKVKALVETTDESASEIVNQALTEYLNQRAAGRVSKHSY